MSLSMYDATVPVFQRMLTSLARTLAVAEAHAEAMKIDPATMLQARLYPDMFPLVRQVQIACDLAKNATARLSGAEPPAYPDDEQSFDDLRRRIDKTLAYIGNATTSDVAGSESRTVALKVAGAVEEIEGKVYLFNFALPNFFFHVTTAYDILRHVGVPIGKRNYYLGGLEFRGGIQQL